MNSKQNIIFFDGYCGLCDRFVTEVFLLDKKHQFYFAALQGPTARQVLNPRPAVDSVIYFKAGKIFLKSHAVLEIMSDLGGIYRLIRILKIIPAGIRDAIYDYIAKNRYGWFGQSQTCRIPNDSEKAYFLD